MTSRFKDFFSAGSAEYATFRPTYPDELFGWLASQCERHTLAWDCATGNGQAALGLAAHFARVIATDGSEAQIARARPHHKVEYRVAPAEASGLEAKSVDLVTVAQALHWLDRPGFYAEARRVARPGARVAVWCYNLLRITPAVDALIVRFYRETLAGCWTPDRALVDAEYRTVEFPFGEVPVPGFAMAADWTLPRLVGYLRTWSGTQRYVQQHGEDPVALLEPVLAAAWGDSGSRRRVSWPLHVRVGWV